MWGGHSRQIVDLDVHMIGKYFHSVKACALPKVPGCEEAGSESHDGHDASENSSHDAVVVAQMRQVYLMNDAHSVVQADMMLVEPCLNIHYSIRGHLSCIQSCYSVQWCQ